jgi:alpha-galactosidase
MYTAGPPSTALRLAEVFVILMLPSAAHAVSVAPDELWAARRWAAAKFADGASLAAPEARLTVVANNDSVQKNARCGRPLRLADRTFWRGLFCHAISQVVVRLPGPAKTFQAVIGVDSNEQTMGGRGSVTFSVGASGKELYRSPVLREGMAPVPVSVGLKDATQFVLEVGDAGDGISCDQADWAEAHVSLADGRVLWLGDMATDDPHLPTPNGEPPFSFTYGGPSSADLLKAWDVRRTTRQLDDRRTEHTITYTDPATGLVARCVAVEYADFPVVEWTLHLANAGAADTPILQDIQALDTVFARYAWPEADLAEFHLHHFTGSPCTPRDYEPHVTRLGPGADQRIAAAGGRPTNSDLCYFNIEWPSEGVIVGVGWPGQWAAQFGRDDGTGLRVRVGQERTHFRLHPGEQVRTPLVALLFYKGDWVRAQNVWRQWMLAHNLPRPGGKLPPCPQLAACSSHQFGEMIQANEGNQKLFVDRYLQEGLKLDYWWMDAGWYVNETGWPNTGTWEVDTKRFPGGLRAITDHAHAQGVKSIVWFEPERVTPGTWLYEEHPEWLLGPNGEQKLLNLGDPEARQWLTEHVDRLIVEQGIDLYRNDFNIDPLPYWRANDTDDRQGITEVRYVEGYLAYWDELRRRHPDMLIDSCASGGRRNDLETLRRAVPLLRSDYIIEPVGNQCHTYGIAFWMPYYGTGSGATDPYLLRSVMCPHFTGCWDMRRDDLDYDQIRRLVGQWRRVAPYFLGDYYPLTSYSAANDVWIAWQFDRPDLGEGMVQVFRRADSIYESARLPLRGLDPEARYRIADVDSRRAQEMAGRDLVDEGLPVRIKHRPGAVILTYRRVAP